MVVLRARNLNGPIPDSIPASTPNCIPHSIPRVEDRGISDLWLQDMALKTLTFKIISSGFQTAQDSALPFQGAAVPCFVEPAE